ncbi:MAG TPA: hypothetical protein VFH67_06530 [bacterium]|nr:hypothetical protein [bacterium]
MPDPAVLQGQRGTDQRIRITRRRKVPRNLHRRGYFSWPVLIPPVYAKQTFIRNFMAPVWHDARRAVAACDRLIFYGYSLPPLDIEAEKEFQRAATRNHGLKYIHIVNPDAASASRYAEAFPRKSVRWHGDIARFLAEEPFA